MVVDLFRYSDTLKKDVQRTFLNRSEKDRKRILDIADPFKVPCIVIVFWCGEVSGWPDYLKKSLDILIDFYNYTEIQNKPEGCPW
ncbi:MAG: hypothetical protein OIN85_00925 [Candidatus Methanoperedens sp.]|nr:hypothetical protein [Candidatus Methanoperedens sp.]